MNLRISQHELRFRLSQDELTRLCTGNSLEQTTPLPGSRVFGISIRTALDAREPLHVDWGSDRLIMTVDAAAAQALLKSLPNRDGIQTKQLLDNDHRLELQLEIDIRNQKKRNDADSK